MTTKSHKQLTGSDLHEPKGADAAAENTLYVANGTGSGSWKKITKEQLTGTGNSFGGQLLHVEHQTSLGNPGGGPSAAGVWTTRPLNISVTNEIPGATLALNQINLPAGTYFFDGVFCSYRIDRTRVRLQNMTTNTFTLVGISGSAPIGSSVVVPYQMTGRFTISGTSAFEVQQVCAEANPSNGFGLATSYGANEVFSIVRIWKIT